MRPADKVLKVFDKSLEVRTDPRPALVCFPFAGGSADTFKEWHHLFSSVKVLAVQFRGRFPDGVEDAMLNCLDDYAAEIVAALEEMLGSGPVFFYGHSFGAFNAWLVGTMLQSKNSPLKLCHLFVGGQQSPYREPRPKNRALSVEAFAKSLVARGFLEQGILSSLQDSHVLKMIESTKNEFTIDEEFEVSKLKTEPPKLKCRVTAFYEAEDESVLIADDVEPWANVSACTEFDCQPIYGPHLFLLAEHNEIELTDYLNEYIAGTKVE